MGQELLIELVSGCNLKCKMCAFKEGFTHQKMSKETIINVFKDIKYINQNSKFYNFTDIRLDGNSEPLLYEDLPFVMECAHGAGIENFNITTNGVLLSREVSDQLLHSRLNTIDISMTGIIPSVYSQFQGYGKPKKEVEKQIETIIENVRYFVEHRQNQNITVTMRYIITPYTQAHFREYIHFFKKLGADAVMGMTLTNVKLREKCKPYEEIVGRKSCESPEHPVICANGDVLLAFCPYEIPVLGNIFETPLTEIFMSKKTETIISAFRRVDIDNLPENCQNCYNTHIYKGGKW